MTKISTHEVSSETKKDGEDNLHNRHREQYPVKIPLILELVLDREDQGRQLESEQCCPIELQEVVKAEDSIVLFRIFDISEILSEDHLLEEEDQDGDDEDEAETHWKQIDWDEFFEVLDEGERDWEDE